MKCRFVLVWPKAECHVRDRPAQQVTDEIKWKIVFRKRELLGPEKPSEYVSLLAASAKQITHTCSISAMCLHLLCKLWRYTSYDTTIQRADTWIQVFYCCFLMRLALLLPVKLLMRRKNINKIVLLLLLLFPFFSFSPSSTSIRKKKISQQSVLSDCVFQLSPINHEDVRSGSTGDVVLQKNVSHQMGG